MPLCLPAPYETLTCCIPSAGGAGQLVLSAADQAALRRQLAEQELLLKAYQAENELAVGRMRQQQAEAQRQAAETQQQVQELQVALALALAQQERERQPPPTPALDGARLQEPLCLQAELESVRAGAWQRQHELQQQVSVRLQE